MKYLLALFMFISLAASGQYDSTKIFQAQNSYGFEWKNMRVNSSWRPPRDTPHMAMSDTGAIAVKGSIMYVWNLNRTVNLYRWDTLSGSGTGITNLGATQNAVNYLITSSTGDSATILLATTSLAGLLDTTGKRLLDSIRMGTYWLMHHLSLKTGKGLYAGGVNGDSVYIKNDSTDFVQNIRLNAGFIQAFIAGAWANKIDMSGFQSALGFPNITYQYLNGYGNLSYLSTDSVLEDPGHLYFHNANARAAISLTTTGTSWPATYNSSTGVLNIPQVAGGSGGNGFKMVLSLTAPTDTTVIWVDTSTNILQAWPMRAYFRGFWTPTSAIAGLYYDPIGGVISNGPPIEIAGSGQSNIFGPYDANPNGTHGDTTGSPFVTVWNDSTRRWERGRIGSPTTLGNGPFYFTSGENFMMDFCKKLAALTGRSIRYTASGAGGTPLDRWSGSPHGIPDTSVQYLNLKNTMARAGIHHPKVFVWCHGDAGLDSNGINGITYYTKMIQFLDSMRSQHIIDSNTIFLSTGLGQPGLAGVTQAGAGAAEGAMRKLEYDKDPYTGFLDARGIDIGISIIHWSPLGHRQMGDQLYSSFFKYPKYRQDRVFGAEDTASMSLINDTVKTAVDGVTFVSATGLPYTSFGHQFFVQNPFLPNMGLFTNDNTGILSISNNTNSFNLEATRTISLVPLHATTFRGFQGSSTMEIFGYGSNIYFNSSYTADERTLVLGTNSLSLGNGGPSANASAILDIGSTSKGILIPRLTTGQISSIGSPATGLLVFNIDSVLTLHPIAFYTGSAWAYIGNVSGGGGGGSYPALTSTDFTITGSGTSAMTVNLSTAANVNGKHFTDGTNDFMKWNRTNITSYEDPGQTTAGLFLDRNVGSLALSLGSNSININSGNVWITGQKFATERYTGSTGSATSYIQMYGPRIYYSATGSDVTEMLGNGWVSVGKGSDAHASAVFEAYATDKGVLFPFLTSSQRAAIASPANGLQVYDTDLRAPFWYNGATSVWERPLTPAPSLALATAGLGYAYDYKPVITFGNNGVIGTALHIGPHFINTGSFTGTDSIALAVDSGKVKFGFVPNGVPGVDSVMVISGGIVKKVLASAIGGGVSSGTVAAMIHDSISDLRTSLETSFVKEITTTDATPVNVDTIVMAAGETVRVEVILDAIKDNGNVSISSKKSRPFLLDAGGTIHNGTLNSSEPESYIPSGSGLSTASFTITNTGNLAIIRFTGEASTTILSKFTYTVTRKSVPL